MRRKNTIYLLVCAAMLLGYIVFLELPSTRESELRKNRLLYFKPAQIETILITNEEQVVELRREGNGWKMVRPLVDRADPQVIGRLLEVLATLPRQTVTGGADKGASKAMLKQFGFTRSKLRLKLVGKAEIPELLFGKDTAVDGKVYVQAGKEVNVVDAALKEQLLQKPDIFRDHCLSDLDPFTVSRVVLKSAAGEIELLKKATSWNIKRPITARADSQKVTELVARTLRARIGDFVNDLNADVTGLNDPQAVLTMYADSRAEPFVLQVGKAAGKNALYAKLQERNTVYTLPKEIWAFIGAKPNELRDRNLVRLDPDMVDRILIQPFGDQKIVLARKQETWLCKGKPERPANNVQALQLLCAIRDAKVTEFSADVATKLPQYGLDQPSLKISFSAFASDNTAESKAGENLIETIHFGKTDGTGVYAKLEDEPFVVKVPRKLLNAIPTDPLQWQDLGVYKFNPADVAALEIKRGGKTVKLVRRGGAWRAGEPGGTPQSVNIESLCNAMGNLRAVRWIGSAMPEHGFASDATVVSFVLANGGGSRLTIGAIKDGFAFATVEDSNIAFSMSRPDWEVFKLPLVVESPSGSSNQSK